MKHPCTSYKNRLCNRRHIMFGSERAVRLFSKAVQATTFTIEQVGDALTQVGASIADSQCPTCWDKQVAPIEEGGRIEYMTIRCPIHDCCCGVGVEKYDRINQRTRTAKCRACGKRVYLKDIRRVQ